MTVQRLVFKCRTNLAVSSSRVAVQITVLSMYPEGVIQRVRVSQKKLCRKPAAFVLRYVWYLCQSFKTVVKRCFRSNDAAENEKAWARLWKKSRRGKMAEEVGVRSSVLASRME